jgi:hypothetical protein
MHRLAHHITTWLRANIWPLAATVTFLIVAVIIRGVRLYTSDDTAIQAVLGSWLHGHHATTWVGPDNFFIKLPIYTLLQVLFPSTHLTLRFCMVLFGVINIWLLWWAGNRLLKRTPTNNRRLLGPLLLWTTTLSYTLTADLLNPNGRNLELGVGLFLIVYCLEVLDGRIGNSRKNLLGALGVVLLYGFLLYSDIYFLYILLVPTTLVCLLTWIHNPKTRNRSQFALIISAFIYVAYKGWSAIADALHIQTFIPWPTTFVAQDDVSKNINLFIHAILQLFHSDFFGLVPLKLGTILILLNLAVLVYLLRHIFTGYKRHESLGAQFIGMQALFACLAFLLSNLPSANVDASPHYLNILVFDVVLLAAMFPFARKSYVKPATIGLCVVTMINLGTMYRDVHRMSAPATPDRQKLFTELKQRGLSKGYADYWSGNINTYLSNFELNFIPVRCESAHARIYYWWMDDALLKIPAEKTFLLYEPQSGLGQECSLTGITQTLGVPAETINVGPSAQLFIYDYDITSKLTPSSH